MTINYVLLSAVEPTGKSKTTPNDGKSGESDENGVGQPVPLLKLKLNKKKDTNKDKDEE